MGEKQSGKGKEIAGITRQQRRRKKGQEAAFIGKKRSKRIEKLK